MDELYVSELAHQYDLSALQPWDLIYGYDFMKASTRSEAIQALDRFKPLLVMLEIDCRQLHHLQPEISTTVAGWRNGKNFKKQDRPLRAFTTSVARRQLQAGRYFSHREPRKVRALVDARHGSSGFDGWSLQL